MMASMEDRPTAIDLSVVIPVYNSEGTVGQVVKGLTEAFAGHGKLQVVLVNDGSTDGSDRVCRSLANAHPDQVTYLLLSRNFGEHNAVMAGLRRSAGRFVVIMDDDMQNPPSEAVRLYQEAERQGLDIAYSRYRRKEHSLLRNMGSRFNGWVADLLLNKPKGLYLSSFKCMSRFTVREVARYHGPYPYIDGLALRATRNIGCVDVEHHPRADGRSGYTPRKLVSLWLNMFVNFSVLPLRASTILGFILVCTAVALAAMVVVEKLLGLGTPTGFAFLVVAIMLFSGAQLFMLGILGEYVGKLFLAVNMTPQSIVREAVGFDPGAGAGEGPHA